MDPPNSKPETRHDAYQWLLQNPHPTPLAANRFCTAASALEFVQRLYGAGAVSVTVPSSAIEVEEWQEGEEQAWHRGEYADTLEVVLPFDPLPRSAVFVLCSNEVQREEGRVLTDQGQKSIQIWWD